MVSSQIWRHLRVICGEAGGCFMNLYCMPSHMFMFLDDAVMVVMCPYSKRGRTNVCIGEAW